MTDRLGWIVGAAGYPIAAGVPGAMLAGAANGVEAFLAVMALAVACGLGIHLQRTFPGEEGAL